MSRYLGAGEYLGAVSSQTRHDAVTASEIVHATGRRLPRHTHESAHLCVLVAGRYMETIGGGELHYHPFAVAYHPPHFSHLDHQGVDRGE